MKRSTKRKLRKAGRKISRWYRKQLATILSVVVTVLCISLVLLVIYNMFDDVRNDESDPNFDQVATTTTTAIKVVSQSAVLEDVDFNYVAFYEMNGKVFSQNTEDIFTWGGERAFNSLRGDVQITSDGKLIMYSEESFFFNEEGKLARNVKAEENSSVLVQDKTWEEVQEFRHELSNSPVCTFEDYLKICKRYKKIAYISIDNQHIEKIIPALLKVLEEQKMINQCIIDSNNYENLKKLRKTNKIIALSYTLPFNKKVTTKEIDSALAIDCCIVNGFNVQGSTTSDDAIEIVDSNVVEYAKERGIYIYEKEVHSKEIAEILREQGISGVQIRRGI